MSEQFITASEFARRAGCDEKQVRRALKAGRLNAGADGRLDTAQLETGWRRKYRGRSKASDNSQMSEANVRAPEIVRTSEELEVEDGETPAQAASRILATAGANDSLNEALRRKENYNALLKQLEYQQKSGALVEMDLAKRVFFEAARGWRDIWLAFPGRVGPLLAADLGLDAGIVTAALTAHVHDQVSQLGTPTADLGQP